MEYQFTGNTFVTKEILILMIGLLIIGYLIFRKIRRKNKNIDLEICIAISFTGIMITCFLWTFVNGGNHWELFGTKYERFLMRYCDYFIIFFSISLIIPLLIKRDKKRILTALLSIPVYFFLFRSFFIFLD